MRRLAALPLVLMGLILTAEPSVVRSATPSPPQVATSQTSQATLDRLFLAYSSGDFTVVQRSLRTEQDFLRLRRSIYDSLPRWKREWQRMHAAFLLDTVIVAIEGGWNDSAALTLAARDFVTARPDRPGANPVNDAFEILWHKTMLGMLEGSLMSQFTLEYLKDISRRVGPRGPGPGIAGAPLVEPRLALAAAIAQEQMTTPGTIARARRTLTAPLTLLPLEGFAKRAAEDAEKRFDEAAVYPSNLPEASIRKAFLLHRLDRFDAALAMLDARAESKDPVLEYLAQLFRGRTLDKLKRPEDAIAAYQLAERAVPGAQSPAVALSVLSLQLDRRSDALQWADFARQGQRNVNDPWWQYWLGDVRFVGTWVAEIRRTAR